MNNKLLHMRINGGDVTIRLLDDIAPNHVRQIQTLSAQKFFDDLPFHRVDDVVVQAGETTDQAKLDMAPPLQAEFSSRAFTRGTLAMARDVDPDSGSHQFFIMKVDASHDNGWWDRVHGNFTVWGEVVEGMEHVDAIQQGRKVEIVPFGENETREIRGLMEEGQTPDTILGMRAYDG